MEEVISDQVAFNTVVTHMLKQDEPAMDDEGDSCVYWNKDTGLKCAIGCLIREEDYTPEMEEKGVEGLIQFDLLPDYLLDIDTKLLGSLQGVHDDCHGSWLEELTNLAIKYNLSMPQVD